MAFHDGNPGRIRSHRHVSMIAAVFFDFAKAFETFSLYICSRLSSIGIHGPMLRYLQSFLSPRSFTVRIGQTHSSTFYSHRGTPHSPTLFLLAINEVTRLPYPSISRSLYIDYLAIYVTTKAVQRAEAELQNFIDKLTLWSHQSGLHITPNKCYSSIFYKL